MARQSWMCFVETAPDLSCCWVWTDLFVCWRMTLSFPRWNPVSEAVFVGSFQGTVVQMCDEAHLFLEIGQDAFVRDWSLFLCAWQARVCGVCVIWCVLNVLRVQISPKSWLTSVPCEDSALRRCSAAVKPAWWAPCSQRRKAALSCLPTPSHPSPELAWYLLECGILTH